MALILTWKALPCYAWEDSLFILTESWEYQSLMRSPIDKSPIHAVYKQTKTGFLEASVKSALAKISSSLENNLTWFKLQNYINLFSKLLEYPCYPLGFQKSPWLFLSTATALIIMRKQCLKLLIQGIICILLKQSELWGFWKYRAVICVEWEDRLKLVRLAHQDGNKLWLQTRTSTSSIEVFGPKFSLTSIGAESLWRSQ